MAHGVQEGGKPHAKGGAARRLLAETAHAVALVTNGTRVALNTWTHCPYRAESKRLQLHPNQREAIQQCAA